MKKGSRITTEESFWKGVIKKKDNDCWVWKRCDNGKGYGITSLDGIRYLTHRLSYELTYGPIPEGMCVLHKCDNPSCCNPKHLFLGSQKDNMKDMTNKKRRIVGEASHYSKLIEEDVIKIRELYSTNKYSQTELGRMFNIDHATIETIVNRKSWKHI